MTRRFIVFTDLDGTLLDHHDYSHTAALPALQCCRDLNIPVVANTSKTRAELASLLKRLELATPFIVENGAAIVFPDTSSLQSEEIAVKTGYRCIELAPHRQSLLTSLAAWLESWSELAIPFSRMSVSDVVALTGLDEASAGLALQRDYSEPVHWQGSTKELVEFCEQARAQGVHVTRGGRFLHLHGGSNKGIAMVKLLEIYKANYPNDEWLSVALGDGQNDISMLNVADYAVRVKSPVAPYPELTRHTHCISTGDYGPAGWNHAVTTIIKQEYRTHG